MNRSLRHQTFLTLIALTALFAGVGIARADCIGPTFSHTGGDLAHGDPLVVSGYGFGDNCYDTGPPPPGEGSLGRPLTEIEISVDQEGQRHLVAVGNADEDYAWEVEIPIPSVLDVGETQVVVVANGFEAFPENPTAIWVTSERDEAASIDVVTFGPTELAEPEPPPESAFQGTNWTPVIGLVAATITIAAGLALLQRRSTR